MYLYSAVLSDNVGISIKNENLLTGLRLLTPTVSMAPNSLLSLITNPSNAFSRILVHVPMPG